MITLRRPQHEPRVEIMPLIDVIFLLLTFFIYAMVLMVRAELLPMQLPEYASGKPAEPEPAVTISIDANGGVYLDRQALTLDRVIEELRNVKAADPETVVFLAVDEQGNTDRLPTFLDLYDRLTPLGLQVRLFGVPPGSTP